MKKSIKTLALVWLLCLLGEVAAWAVPAYNKPRRVAAPDGTTLTLVGRGDEFCHFLTTTDGYTVVKGADGFYRYADVQDGQLVAGPVLASDADKRVASETAYLKGKSKFLAPALTSTAKRLKAHASMRNDQTVARNMRKIKGQNKDYRGLLILVDFNDRSFTKSKLEMNSYYKTIMNTDNLTKYTDRMDGVQQFTGSVRDYFVDNSYGAFTPTFDVVGPITLDGSQYDIDCINNSYEQVMKILRQADDKIDYSLYDCDGDGEMDMVYILYAGYASSYSGNDERLVWPHAGSMKDYLGEKKSLVLDGVEVGRFACSAEIFGWQDTEDTYLDGIGVIVHEFSHVLGFQDHYDTSNGYQEHPNEWDVMSAGNYSEDFNRTPVAYNSYEKYAAGFINPLDITSMGGESVSLKSTEISTDACILRSYQDDVFFIMENRQKDKWDKYLPGRGMLVWRVDSTNVEYWKKNVINVTTRACFRLVRACGTQGSFLTGVVDTSYDSFPGTHNITELDNDEDAANLITYDQYPCPVVLRNIKEASKVITFDVERDEDARKQPITYSLPDKFTAHAERRNGEEWEPVAWTVSASKSGDTYLIANLIPNKIGVPSSTGRDYSKGVFVSYTYSNEQAHSIMVNAQRVALNDEYSIWLSDLNSVNNQGTGALTMTVGRYGIPTLDDAAVQLSFCSFKPKAYVATQKNLIEELDVYRNITFTDYDPSAEEVDGIDSPTLGTYDAGGKKWLEGSRIVIGQHGRRYNVAGQQLK